MKKSNVIGVMALVLSLLISGRSAEAGSKIVDYIDTTLTRLRGAIETNTAGNVDPFVLQIYTRGNECVVIAVVTQGIDLTATLVSTGGTIWYDDDSGGSLKPLIKAITDTRGWYPLTFSTFAGFAGTSDITFDYGRFAANSPKCAGATPPRALAESSTNPLPSPRIEETDVE
jgi:hypothetical protein